MNVESTYQCINNCATFTTIGVPAYCPHCGSKEVHQLDSSVTTFRTVDEYYENESPNRGTRERTE